MPLPPGKKTHPAGIYRFRSKDGKAWQAFEGPINLETSDSCYLYRTADDQYVAFHKTERSAFSDAVTPCDIADGGVRLISLRTSSDGTNWSDPMRLVMTPDWRDPDDTQFMELCPVAIPGGYVATVTIYHNYSQRVDLQWAASRDGVTWWRPSRDPALPNPPLGDVGVGHVALSIGANPHHMIVGVPTRHEKKTAVVHHRRHELFGGPIDSPVSRTVVRIKAGNALATRQYYLHAPVNLTNNQCCVTSYLVTAHGAPTLFSRLLIERNHIRITVVITVDNDHVFEQHGTAREAMGADKVANPDGPFLFAFHIIRGNDNFPRVDQSLGTHVRRNHLFVACFKKGYINPLAIGCRCTRGKTV